MSVHELSDLLRTWGLPLSFLIVLVVTGARRMWSFGWVLKEKDDRLAEKDEEIKRERTRGDWWQQRCLDQSSMLDRSLELAMRGVKSQKRGD